MVIFVIFVNVLQGELLRGVLWMRGKRGEADRTVSPAAFLLFTELFIEIWVERIIVFAVQVIQNEAESFTEALVVYDLSFAQIADRVTYFRIFYEAQYVVVREARFLFSSHIFVQIRDWIPGGLDHRRAPRLTGSRLWPKADRVVDIVGGEALFLEFIGRQVFRELVDDGADDFHVGELFGTDIGQDTCYFAVGIGIALGKVAHGSAYFAIGSSLLQIGIYNQ